MKRILSALIAAVMVLSALCVFAGAEEAVPGESKVATAIYGTPVIDGDKDPEWSNAQINPVTLVFANDEMTDPCVAQFRVMYDEFYLYFYVEVLDNTMPEPENGLEWELNGSNSWYNRDGVAFMFAPDGDTSETGTQVAPAFWYIIRAFGSAANYNQVPQNVFVTEDADAEMADQNDFEKHPMANRMYAISYVKDASGALTGYNLECKVNLKARYEAFKAEPNTKIGFDMNINNNNYLLMSASRNYALIWNDETCSSYKNNALKGTIVLADKGTTFKNDNETLTLPGEETEPETEPAATEPVATEPVATEPVATEPVATEPVATEPVATDAPGTDAPSTDKPADTKSGCGSFAAIGVAAVLLIGSAFVTRKH